MFLLKMDTSIEKSLLSELKHVCNRLGEAAAGILVDPSGSKEKIDSIGADLDELRVRIREQGAANF